MRTKIELDEEFIKKHQGKHFCKCGCGRVIKIIPYHRIYGIPDYILNHILKINSKKRIQIKNDLDKKFIEKYQGKHFCKCGCEEIIKIIPSHRIEGIPKYIKWHHSKTKEKRDEEFIKKHQGKHFCKCGCNQKIIILSCHRLEGIPKFFLGHYWKTKEGRTSSRKRATKFKNKSEEIEAQSKRSKEFQNRPEEKERMSKQATEFMNRPGEKEKAIAYTTEFMNRPEEKEKVSKRATKMWKNVETRKGLIKKIKEYNNRPEVKKEKSETATKYATLPEAKRKFKERMKNVVTPTKDTSIEIKIQNFLKQLGISFFTHQYMKIKHGYQCDILIPGINLIIECDGDFFHCNPIKYSSTFVRYPNDKKIVTAQEVWNKDNIRTKELIQKGFKVLRLWEFEINAMSINEFEKKLKTK